MLGKGRRSRARDHARRRAVVGPVLGARARCLFRCEGDLGALIKAPYYGMHRVQPNHADEHAWLWVSE